MSWHGYCLQERLTHNEQKTETCSAKNCFLHFLHVKKARFHLDRGIMTQYMIFHILYIGLKNKHFLHVTYMFYIDVNCYNTTIYDSINQKHVGNVNFLIVKNAKKAFFFSHALFKKSTFPTFPTWYEKSYILKIIYTTRNLLYYNDLQHMKSDIYKKTYLAGTMQKMLVFRYIKEMENDYYIDKERKVSK